jgi:hypothetical protein
LGKLGIAVSERTVSRLLRRRRRPPSQTWRTFLTNHVASLVSLDVFTVPTLTGRVLFVLVLGDDKTAALVLANDTPQPSREPPSPAPAKDGIRVRRLDRLAGVIHEYSVAA